MELWGLYLFYRGKFLVTIQVGLQNWQDHRTETEQLQILQT